MDTRALKHFLAVYDHGQFGRAADALGISKQGLSRSIANLEESIDAKLFTRGRNGAKPNEFGEALASHARLILAETKIAEDEIAGLKNADSGAVRIGVTATMSDRILPTAVTNIVDQSTKADIYVESKYPAELLEALTEGQFDLVAGSFRPGMEIPETVEKEVLFTYNDTIVCNPDHPIVKKSARRKTKLKLADLEPYPWIVPTKYTWVVDKVNNAFQKAGFVRPRNYMHSGESNFLRGVLMRSNYLSYGNGNLFSSEIDHGLLAEVYIPQLTDMREAVILTRKNSVPTIMCVRLIQEIRDTVSKLTDLG